MSPVEWITVGAVLGTLAALAAGYLWGRSVSAAEIETLRYLYQMYKEDYERVLRNWTDSAVRSKGDSSL